MTTCLNCGDEIRYLEAERLWLHTDGYAACEVGGGSTATPAPDNHKTQVRKAMR